MNDLNLSEFMRGQIWPILPAAFEGMFSRLHKAQDGDGLQAIARLSQGADKPKLYELINGVAVIPISGPIMKRASLFSFFFGATSYPFIRRAVRDALEDDEVESIVLKIDSPGGVVNGVEETGDLIFNARQEKPIVAFADGMMASAAYWLGSAAETVIAGKTSQIGSIGVLMVHEDWSRWNEDKGIKVSYLTAGKYKALGNPDEPLSDLARETFQAELNYIYTIFIDTIARNRDVEPEDVLAKMADGRIFIGQQALDAGLIDRISTLQTAVDSARDMADDGRQNYNTRRIIKMPKDITIENIEQLRAEFPDLVKQIETAATAGIDTAAIETTARESERDRVLGLASVQFGEEKGAKFRAVVETGVTVEAFQAVMDATGGQAETDETKSEAAAIQAKADALKEINVAGAANPGADNTQAGSPDYMQLVADYQRENKCSKFQAMQAVNRANPEARQKYVTAAQTG